jgi:hypothetical protein
MKCRRSSYESPNRSAWHRDLFCTNRQIDVPGTAIFDLRIAKSQCLAPRLFCTNRQIAVPGTAIFDLRIAKSPCLAPRSVIYESPNRRAWHRDL